MTTLYFDITDVIDFASRYSRVTGIQRVQMNIVTHLARKHGGERVRCTYYDVKRRGMLEFDPAQLSANEEFDAEALLADLNVTTRIAWLRGLSKPQIKSSLRRYNHRKWFRALKKIEIYFAAIFMPTHLAALGLSLPKGGAKSNGPVALTQIDLLPPSSVYVCMGSIWRQQDVLKFAKQHSAQGGAVVQMVYDLIPVVHPEYYALAEPREYAEWLQDAFKYVRGFMCISKWTESDLRAYATRFNCDVNTHVAPLAHEFHGFARGSRIDRPADLESFNDKPFVLCVGTIETRKNGVALLKAWRALIDDLGARTPLLVFAGKYGKGGELVQRMLDSDSQLARYVRLEHAPSDRQLAWLYGQCLFTVFPSTYEGWGLPVGESAWFGKYCVASNATSIPEVCGGLLAYIDPNDVAGLQSAIKKLIVEPDVLPRLEKNIYDAPLRSWASVADDIYAYAAGI